LNKDTIIARLKDSWLDIWSWMSYLLNNESEDLKGLAHRACCAVVVCLGADQDMRELMASTPGTIALIVKLWVVEQDPTYSLDTVAPISIPTFPASRAVCMFMDSERPIWIAEVFAAVRRIDVDLASIVLGTIKRRIEHSPLDIPALNADLSILHDLWDIQDLHADLFGGPAMHILKNTMVRLLGSQGSDCEGAVICLTYCAKYYVCGLFVTQGRSWACRMYDAPIIHAIVQASIWSTVNDSDLGDVLDSLTPYLLFRTVLRRAEKALLLMHELHLEKDMNEGGRVYDAFQRYHLLVVERLVIAEGRSLGTKSCDNQPVSLRMKNFHFLIAESLVEISV
jgi:hypothetical protein